MLGDYVAPISTVTARDLTKALIKEDARFRTNPNICDAIILAKDLENEGHGFTDPNYLLSVWMEIEKD